MGFKKWAFFLNLELVILSLLKCMCCKEDVHKMLDGKNLFCTTKHRTCIYYRKLLSLYLFIKC